MPPTILSVLSRVFPPLLPIIVAHHRAQALCVGFKRYAQDGSNNKTAMQNSICTFLRIYDVMYSFVPRNSQILVGLENVVSSYDIIPLYELCIK